MIDVIQGKYRIVREIARSNDIVYEAIDASLGRRIALKELNIAPGMTGQARRERIERFNREARAAGKLNHPNIISVTDFFEENGRYFIVMEYLEGQTLRDIMQVRGAFPLGEAVNIACQMLDALSYAHRYKVIHRDIKPDNIFILPGGIAKLADFGIARLTEEPALTSNGQVFGTPSYMSPEQIEGREIDHRSDIFSLGVLLYEMLAGRKPFVGDSVISITYAVMNAEPPAMNGVPMGIEQVIRRALSKNPAGRQRDADQMKLDLRAAEQTPAVFLQNNTQMGGNFPGAGNSGAFPAGGFSSPYPTQGASPMAAPSQMGSASYLPQASPQGGTQLPWSWNSAGAASPPAVRAPIMPPAQSGYAPQATPGAWQRGAPPYPIAPPEPVFVLTPGGRMFLTALAVAAVIGGGIAFGVLGLANSYSRYQQAAGVQRIAVLINDGGAAYNSGDFAKAETVFRQALDSSPNAAQRDIIRKNLAYTCVQEARAANGRGDWQGARTDYEKALGALPDYDSAHKELGDLLALHGDLKGANDQRSAVSSGSGNDSTPTQLDRRLPASAVAPAENQNPNQFLEESAARARKLIAEGDELARENNLDEARKRWQQAIEAAPGSSEHDEAQERLKQYPPASDGG